MAARKKPSITCTRQARIITAMATALVLMAAGIAVHVRYLRKFEPLPADLKIDSAVTTFDENLADVRRKSQFDIPSRELGRFQNSQARLAVELAAEAAKAEEERQETDSNTGTEAIPQDFAPVNLRLNGIVRSDNSRRALVNQTVLAVNESISGVKIIDITSESVIFMDANGITKEVMVHESFLVPSHHRNQQPNQSQ